MNEHVEEWVIDLWYDTGWHAAMEHITAGYYLNIPKSEFFQEGVTMLPRRFYIALAMAQEAMKTEMDGEDDILRNYRLRNVNTGEIIPMELFSA